ncbi:hypothetical protein UFOVP775_43 [uncultured Caudovirales phage]|uniref:Uncharacterized protein n=1 Tax=uncultured Caudovirales phage TaxID=2100421 RepID=A0A6J5NSW5_9CAUD|nr:hypothetical protein UFOVP775_43 [uncultured Caudovirales phage]
MTAGYNDRTCTNGKGGIKSVMLFPLGNVTSANVNTSNEVDTLTVSGEVFLYKLKSNLSSYTAPIRVNKGNGTLWYEQTLTMILASDTKELRNEIHLLGQNEVVALVEKADGTIVALGFGEGLQIAEASAYGSGVLKSDRLGHDIIMGGLENDPVPDVDPIIYNTLIGQQSPSI